MWKKVMLGGGLGVLGLIAFLWWRGMPAPAPPPALPNPNAYDFYVRAGNAVSGPVSYAMQPPAAATSAPPASAFAPGASANQRNTANRVYAPAEKTALLAQNAPALRLLRQGFAHECGHPPVRSLSPAAGAPGGSRVYSNFRQLARLLALEAQVEAARGDWNQAASSCLDGVRLGVEVPRGAPYIGWLVGVACEHIARRELWNTVEHLSAAQAQSAARRLEVLATQRTSLADALTEEKLAMQIGWPRGFGWDKGAGRVAGATFGRWVMNNNARYMDALAANARAPYAAPKPAPATPRDPFNSVLTPVYGNTQFNAARNKAGSALLMTALALRAFRVERGSYPQLLAELAPGYLKKAPDDPFALNALLVYKRAGESYQLYSIGPDGKDDGGKAVYDPRRRTPSSRHLILENSKGDIVAGINK